MSAGAPETCPRCGNFNPSISRELLPYGARYCTPISCDAWTFTARLTKQGQKPIRPDGRADLRAAAAVSSTEKPGNG